MKIALCGFMGCGKTTKGKKLAERLGAEFIDTDDLIVQKENMSINDIFSTFGEEYFRDRETDVIREVLSSDTDIVISLGGGTVMREQNRDMLKEKSTVFFIKTPISVICKRLTGDKNRPLFNAESASKLYESRLPVYEKTAHYIVDDNSDIDDTVDIIYNLLND